MYRITRAIRRANVVVACAIGIAGCGDVSAPLPDPAVTARVVSITRVASPADTIDATLVDALLITVRNGKGAPISNASVRVEWSSPPGAGPVTLAPAGATAFASTIILATDAQGMARASLRLGRSVGRGFVTATETSKAIKDSVEVFVAPGSFFRSSLAVRDTAMLVGGRITVSGSAFDRADNATPLTFAATGTACTLTTGGVVTGVNAGVCRIAVSQPTGASFRVTVIAPSVMLEGGLQGFATIRLDGTEHTPIPLPVLAYDNCGLLGSGKSFLCTRVGLLYLLGLDGSVTPIPTPGVGNIRNSRVSRDGNWVVFTGYPVPQSNGNTTLYRVRIDGSQLQVLSPDCCSIVESNFDVSPDGKVVIYSSYSTLRLDVANHTTSTIALGRERTPRFSPDGSMVAYQDGMDILVSNTDGSNVRVIFTPSTSTPGPYFIYLEWSPDSKWLLTLGVFDKPFLIAADGSATLSVNLTGIRNFVP